MAISASGLYVTTYKNIVTNAYSVPINLTASTYRLGLLNNSITPNYATDHTYSGAYTTNEVVGTGFNSGNAGGQLLSAAASGASVVPIVATTTDNGGLKYDHTNDVAVNGTTLANIYGCFIHTNANNGVATNVLVCLVWFGGTPYSTSSGTFGIQWSTGGVFSIDLTP